MSAEILNEIKTLQTDFKNTWADVQKLHDDLKAEKSTRDADVDTFKQADALRKEQLETMTAKMNELELSIARHKEGLKRSNEPLNEKTERLWHLYAEKLRTTPDKLDRKAIKSAFSEYGRKGDKMTGADSLKLLSTQDNANGGYLVVPELENEIDKILADTSAVRSVARVRTVASSVFEIVQRTGRPTAATTGEGSAAAQTNSTYGKVSIPNRRYTAEIAATNEEVQDAMWSLEAEIRADAAEEFDFQQGQDFVNGSGVNEPEGLWTATGIAEVNSGAATAISYTGLIRVSHGDSTNGGFNRNYHANARFAMNLVTLGSARLLEDTGNNLIFQPGVGEIESTIAGFPYVIFPDAPSEAANAYPVMFGDFFKGYVIVDRAGLSLLVNPYRTSGIVLYELEKRTGGKVVRTEVFRKLKCAA